MSRIYSFLLHCLLVALVCVGVTHTMQAQLRDSRGTDFWFAFPPNFHNGIGATDSLYIAITGDEATAGALYLNLLGRTDSIPFRITDPAQIVTISLGWSALEFQGFNAGGQRNPTPQTLQAVRQTLRLRSDKEVTVYAMNLANRTTDAMLILPTDALGTEYFVMAYPSDQQGTYTVNTPGSNTPSQFIVIATQPQTQVQINTAGRVFGSAATSFTVILNQGEAYLVQADMAFGDVDLTGSRVVSNKPVAVISGHQRTTLPLQFKPGLSSRDCLLESMPPLDTWGRSIFITPYIAAQNESPTGTDLYRVMAGFDNTVVRLNGAVIARLNAGQFFEGALTSPGLIEANNQVLVAQFKKTGSGNNTVNNPTGDPFMMVIPPAEQYSDSYRFICIQGQQPGNNTAVIGPAFNQHYATLVAPTANIGSVQLDGGMLAANTWTRIPNTPYSYINARVSQGVHTVKADTSVGLYVYGYGEANSYGYIGGGKLLIISPDRFAPRLASTATCFSVSGSMSDTLELDTGIDVFEAISTANVRVNIESYQRYAKRVGFSAQLLDTLRDGEFILQVRDSARNATSYPVIIPGFTIQTDPVPQNVRGVLARTALATSGLQRCYTVPLVNYGRTVQTISSLRLSGRTPGLRIADQAPIALRPGERRVITLCFFSNDTTGIFNDTLFVNNGCFERPLLTLSLALGRDNVPPSVQASGFDCTSRTAQITIADTARFSAGLASVQVNSITNTTIRVITASTMNVQQYVITVTDLRRDAIYETIARDSLGQERRQRDTISGYTVQFTEIPANVATLGTIKVGDIQCRNLIIRNYGVRAFRFDVMELRRNVEISIPPTERFIEIPPNTERTLRVCSAPLNLGVFRDTLVIGAYCVNERYALEMQSAALERTVISRCSASLSTISTTAPKRFYTEQNYPNPAQDATTLRVGVERAGKISITFVSMNGMMTERVLDQVEFPAGEHQITIDTRSLATGLYAVEIRTDGGERSVRMMSIVR
jgi:hypothetical protein